MKISRIIVWQGYAWSRSPTVIVQEGQFEQNSRKGVDAFEALVDSIRSALDRDAVTSMNRTGIRPKTPKNKVEMTYRGSFHSIRALAGVSTADFYSTVAEVMKAICPYPRYKIVSPVHDIESITATQFAEISRNNILTGCVGCGDDWLCTIKAPSSKAVSDVSAFFQVTISVTASIPREWYCFSPPSKVADSVTFKKWPLFEVISKLTFGYYVIADNAYPLSSSVLAPFTKPEIKSSEYSDYNLYQSQLRIRIEMAVGLLVNKWQLFKRPLSVDYCNSGLVIKTCMKLHNYCIDERIGRARQW
ncbi:hypothetical protein PHMEG_00013686 [Phytophthora megakarya]|uniref:DDE Tnp4 domain-containing protein n=1 Tax=Phytophthora megakarya TaxID=4795 RepID=A0A225W893_9STRA|nr:hypothetical protein PHMEG_00013686 [Phytophthora megakarya]